MFRQFSVFADRYGHINGSAYSNILSMGAEPLTIMIQISGKTSRMEVCSTMNRRVRSGKNVRFMSKDPGNWLTSKEKYRSIFESAKEF